MDIREALAMLAENDNYGPDSQKALQRRMITVKARAIQAIGQDNHITISWKKLDKQA